MSESLWENKDTHTHQFSECNPRIYESGLPQGRFRPPRFPSLRFAPNDVVKNLPGEAIAREDTLWQGGPTAKHEQ